MYSYEQRIRAVKLYIKLGKRTGPTIRQLGYSTKNSLKCCYREYERNPDLQVVYIRSGVKYTAEQIQVAVQHYFDLDQCIASTLRALGYPCRDLLTRWIDELHSRQRRLMVAVHRIFSTHRKSKVLLSLICATSWAIGDKTGTNKPDTNDIGILLPPQGAPLLATAYLADSSASNEVREATMPEVTQLVAHTLQK